ncbi:hypothetical protein Cni_G14334 [Canna indica]|uniref:FLZ-type domain-containing protein n=1 Tax=Canna indica TaxID=4628 RepID=A0AAQ3KBW0_9LILI|nr:hypothetical protein Cni_G14334 [Canna indica]
MELEPLKPPSPCSPSSPSSSRTSFDADIEAGFSGCAIRPPPPPSRAQGWRSRGGSYGAAMASTGARFFVDDCFDEPRHFLDSCFLCKRPLAGNRDIFMYRGDTPFCSVECRQEQIETDEARVKKLDLSLKKSSATANDQQNASASRSPKSQKIHVRTGTLVAG